MTTVQDTLHLVVNNEAPLCVPATRFLQHIQVLDKFKKGVAHFAGLPVSSLLGCQ